MTEESGMTEGDGRAAAAWLPLPLRERAGVRGNEGGYFFRVSWQVLSSFSR